MPAYPLGHSVSSRDSGDGRGNRERERAGFTRTAAVEARAKRGQQVAEALVCLRCIRSRDSFGGMLE
jgi:hypothetical protein